MESRPTKHFRQNFLYVHVEWVRFDMCGVLIDTFIEEISSNLFLTTEAIEWYVHIAVAQG